MIGFRPAPLLSLGALLGVAVLCMVGVWQLQRMEEKAALFAAVVARQDAPGLNAAEVGNEPTLEFRAVNAAVADGSVQSLWGASARSFQLGRLADGRAILIETARNGASLQPGARVSGILRKVGRDPDLPHDEPAKGLFFAPDRALAEKLGAPADMIWYVAALRLATPSGQTMANPRADPTKSLLGPERHLGYALTWFGLAIALIAVTLVLHAKLGRLSFDPARKV
jgi:surfeit locus 1 family protein